MEKSVISPQLVDKEAIPRLKFPSDEVLKDPLLIAERSINLHRATILGNLEKYKFKIIFKDSENVKTVYTTIWAMGEKHIVLKRGVTIPINRVMDVKIYQ